MSADDRRRWDAKYAKRSIPDQLTPTDSVVEHAQHLPPGRALDLACGLGHNALWLARQGWSVDAIDISPVGIELARQFAASQNLGVNWIVSDLEHAQVDAESYDLVVVTKFLDRNVLPPLAIAALKPGGRLIYETFTTRTLKQDSTGCRNPAFMLEPNELPTLFPELNLHVNREYATPVGTLALFVGEKARPTETTADSS